MLTATSQNSCKNKKNDVVETEDNIRREETHAKSGMSKVNKSLLEKNPYKVMQPIETENWYSPLQSEENPTDNGSTRTDSPDTKITAKQNSVNTTTQNVESSNNIK